MLSMHINHLADNSLDEEESNFTPGSRSIFKQLSNLLNRIHFLKLIGKAAGYQARCYISSENPTPKCLVCRHNLYEGLGHFAGCINSFYALEQRKFAPGLTKYIKVYFYLLTFFDFSSYFSNFNMYFRSRTSRCACMATRCPTWASLPTPTPPRSLVKVNFIKIRQIVK